METQYLNYHHLSDSKALQEAAALIRKGELVAFPTETVYGLGADATNEKAVEKIFQAKGRPGDNPLIVHLADKKQLNDLVLSYPDYVDSLMDAYSPGPITYVLPSNGRAAKNVTAGLATVGIRFPSHPAARSLLQACDCPLAAPSANLSGKPSPTTAQHVREDMDGRIAAILDGGAAEVGVESTVIDCTGDQPVILRLGEVTETDIRSIVNVRTNQAKKVDKPKSPGTKYKHYMPEIPLVLVRDIDKLQEFIDKERASGKRVGALVTNQTASRITADKIYRYGANEQELARNLYHELRLMNKTDVDMAVAEYIPEEEIGSAVLDRLSRAATKII